MELRSIKTLLIKGAAIVAVLWACCCALEKVVESGVRKSPVCREWEDLFASRINCDLLIQGSSRAWVHVSPRAIDQALNVNSYNLGLDAYNFMMQYYRFKVYLEHNRKPRYIVQCLDDNALDRRANLVNIRQFGPYLKDPYIRKAVGFYEGFEWQDFVVPLAKYMNVRNGLLDGITDFVRPEKSNKYKGFEAQQKQWDDSFEIYRKANPNGVHQKTDAVTVGLFEDFLSYCVNNGIKVILVYTPQYIEGQRLIKNKEQIIGLYRGFAKKYDIPFLDYSDDPVCYDTKYFYNSEHLNAKGVAIFNEHLVRDLAPLERWPVRR